MKTSRQILPGVKAVHWLDCQHLPRRVDLHGICRMPVPVLTALSAVEVFDDAECACVTEREGGSFQDTATLKFLTHELLPINLKLGFVVTSVEGKSYLVGSKEAPFPKVKVEQRCGLPGGDSAGYFYEISHVSLKSLVECHISADGI